jgi:hypothetical protein
MLFALLMVVLFAVPAIAGESASSQVTVGGISGVHGTGVSGTFTSATNSSSASSYKSGGTVATSASSVGTTLALGFHGAAFAGQTGSASASAHR